MLCTYHGESSAYLPRCRKETAQYSRAAIVSPSRELWCTFSPRYGALEMLPREDVSQDAISQANGSQPLGSNGLVTSQIVGGSGSSHSTRVRAGALHLGREPVSSPLMGLSRSRIVVVSPPRIAKSFRPPSIALGNVIRVLSLGLSSRLSTLQYVLFSSFSRVGGAVSLAARVLGKARCWCLNAALV